MIKSQKNELFENPVIAAQVLESPFVPDSHIGHTMPKGKDFIGRVDYLGIDALTDELRKEKRKIVLNIGDSSTSGWDSNVIALNRERKNKNLSPLSAFFRYQTYSDYLREFIGNEFVIVNAGVPAHTSLQGSRRLNRLIEHFKKENIIIHFITAYYGNNDCVWDNNRQDKEWVGRKKNNPFNEISKFFKKKGDDILKSRVSAPDFEKNMKKIVETCLFHEIKIIIIEPVTPIYWKPGCRVLNERLERKYGPSSKQVYRQLDEGLALWNHAMKETTYTELKRSALEEVKEKDYIVPRIKREYLTTLRALVKKANVPYVTVHLDRSSNDSRYFIDYCHPIGEANKVIANELAAIVTGEKTCKEHTSETKKHINDLKSPQIKLSIPTDHYTLY